MEAEFVPLETSNATVNRLDDISGRSSYSFPTSDNTDQVITKPADFN